MRASRLKSKAMPIGLDFGGSCVRMLQLGGDEGEYEVISAGRYELPPGLGALSDERKTALIDACTTLLELGQYVGNDVSVSLPDASVEFKNLRMPAMSAADLEQALHIEANERLQMGEDGGEVHHLVAGQVQKGAETNQEVILMGATRACMEFYLDVLAEAKLRPASIEVTPTALARCFHRMADHEAEEGQVVEVVVDIGHSGTKVLVLRDGHIAFYKVIDVGSSKLNEAVSEYLDMSGEDAVELRRRQSKVHEGQSDDDKMFGSVRNDNVDRALFEAIRSVAGELAREIGLCLRYYSVTFRGARPSSVLLCGGEACDTQLAQLLGELMDTQVTVADPLAGIELGSARSAFGNPGQPMADWCVVTGLALRSPAGQREERGAA